MSCLVLSCIENAAAADVHSYMFQNESSDRLPLTTELCSNELGNTTVGDSCQSRALEVTILNEVKVRIIDLVELVSVVGKSIIILNLYHIGRVHLIIHYHR